MRIAKKLIAFGLIALMVLLVIPQLGDTFGQHEAGSYIYYKNGRWIRVPLHWGIDLNGKGEDNFNYPPTWNPNKDEITPGDRKKWLREYYNQDSYPALSSQKPYFRGLDSTEEYHARGRNYYRNGEFDLAIKDYNQALALNPRSAYLYKDRGIAYGKLGKLNEAVADYTQAIKLYPGFAVAYYHRAVTYFKLGEYDKALQDLYQAKDLFENQEDKTKTEEFIQRIIAED